MTNPESSAGYQWNADEDAFIKRVIDSTSGVETVWRRTVGKGLWVNMLPEGEYLEVKTNNFPGDGPMRNVHHFTESSGSTKSISYSIYDILSNGFKREVDLPHTQYDDPNDRPYLELGLMEVISPHHRMATIEYSRVGTINSIRLFIQGKRDETDVNYNKRNLEDNLHEFADIIRAVGIGMFVPSTVKNDAEAKLFLLFADGIGYSGLKQRFGDEADLKVVETDAKAAVKVALETHLREETLSLEHKEVIEDRIVSEMTHLTLPHNYNYMDETEKSQQLAKSLEEAVAHILWDYTYKITSTGDFHVHFVPSEKDMEEEWQVTITDRDIKPLLEDRVRNGQRLTYSEYSIIIEEINDNTRININGNREIIVPSHLDIEQIKSLATIEEPVGWEKALDLVSVSVR